MDQQAAEPAEPPEPIYIYIYFLKKSNGLIIKFAFGHKEE